MKTSNDGTVLCLSFPKWDGTLFRFSNSGGDGTLFEILRNKG